MTDYPLTPAEAHAALDSLDLFVSDGGKVYEDWHSPSGFP